MTSEIESFEQSRLGTWESVEQFHPGCLKGWGESSRRGDWVPGGEHYGSGAAPRWYAAAACRRLQCSCCSRCSSSFSFCSPLLGEGCGDGRRRLTFYTSNIPAQSREVKNTLKMLVEDIRTSLLQLICSKLIQLFEKG